MFPPIIMKDAVITRLALVLFFFFFYNFKKWLFAQKLTIFFHSLPPCFES